MKVRVVGRAGSHSFDEVTETHANNVEEFDREMLDYAIQLVGFNYGTYIIMDDGLREYGNGLEVKTPKQLLDLAIGKGFKNVEEDQNELSPRK